MSNKLTLEFDTTELNELQIRLIKRVANMLDHTLHTDKEADFFESSAELLRVVAETVKYANFNNNQSEIDHAEQALQYCVDRLSDQIYQNDFIKHDC